LAYLLGYHSLKATLLVGDMRLLRLSLLEKAKWPGKLQKEHKKSFSFEEKTQKPKYKQDTKPQSINK